MSAGDAIGGQGGSSKESVAEAAEKQRRLEAWYQAAQKYDKSWVLPPNSFHTWRKGKPRPPGEPPGETIFDHLVKLGVLEKIEEPISKRREWEEEA